MTINTIQSASETRVFLNLLTSYLHNTLVSGLKLSHQIMGELEKRWEIELEEHGLTDTAVNTDNEAAKSSTLGPPFFHDYHLQEVCLYVVNMSMFYSTSFIHIIILS